MWAIIALWLGLSIFFTSRAIQALGLDIFTGTLAFVLITCVCGIIVPILLPLTESLFFIELESEIKGTLHGKVPYRRKAAKVWKSIYAQRLSEGKEIVLPINDKGQYYLYFTADYVDIFQAPSPNGSDFSWRYEQYQQHKGTPQEEAARKMLEAPEKQTVRFIPSQNLLFSEYDAEKGELSVCYLMNDEMESFRLITNNADRWSSVLEELCREFERAKKAGEEKLNATMERVQREFPIEHQWQDVDELIVTEEE